jgi:uncharacterized coiled-coil protein SlyX
LKTQIINLETKVAYLEDYVEQLNLIVIEQVDQIKKLTFRVERLLEEVLPSLDGTDIKDVSLEVPPPHY